MRIWQTLLLAGLLVWAGGCDGQSAAPQLGEVAEMQAPNPPAETPAQPNPPAAVVTSQPDEEAAPASPAEPPDLTEELNAIRDTWLKRLGEGHSASVRSPFVVIINGPQRQADAWMARTVAPAAERIGRKYMKVHPDKPMTVLLFVDQKTYRAACSRHLQVDDPPHFGFFRPWQRLLVMDIRTGGGTLVHELTHAMIDFDFPAIPDWFNEGLGSLYEQCHFTRDDIRGLVNWRLPALQKAIKADKLGSFEELTRKRFRGSDVGLNYAQARYLCLYMQKEGVLEDFYKSFRDGHADDPTGLAHLKAAFPGRDLAEVEKEWRKWVMTLRFPAR